MVINDGYQSVSVAIADSERVSWLNPVRKCTTWHGGWSMAWWRKFALHGAIPPRTRSCRYQVSLLIQINWYDYCHASLQRVFQCLKTASFHSELILGIFGSVYLQGPEDTTDTTGIMEAKLTPWMSECLLGFNNGMRRLDNECIIGLFNLTTQGVLSVDKLHFALHQVTSLCHAYPKTFVGVVVMPNRAGDLRTNATNANGCKPWA